MSIKISNLSLISNQDIMSSYFPASDIGNDITYKISMQSIYNNLSVFKNNQIKTTSYTISTTDYNSNIIFNNQDINNSVQLIIPKHSQQKISLGFTTNIIRNNAGDVVISPENGVEILPGCNLYLREQYSVATITKIELNKWILSGDLSASGNTNTNTPSGVFSLSGAGTTYANGCYSIGGTYGNKPYYTNGILFIWYDSNNIPELWNLTDVVGSASLPKYSVIAGIGDEPPNSWFTQGGGIEPAPTQSSGC